MKKTYIVIEDKQLKVIYWIIAILLLLSIVMSLMGYRLQLESANLAKENKNLKGLVEYQSSAIADLEENLREGSNK